MPLPSMTSITMRLSCCDLGKLGGFEPIDRTHLEQGAYPDHPLAERDALVHGIPGVVTTIVVNQWAAGVESPSSFLSHISSAPLDTSE